jgi:WD40 repeat protein
VASAFTDVERRTTHIRVFDLETGAFRDLDPRVKGDDCLAEGTFEFYVSQVQFLPDGRLLAETLSGLRLFDVERGTSRLLRAKSKDDCKLVPFALSPDGATLAQHGTSAANSRISLSPLLAGPRREITTHGTDANAVAFDPTGNLIVSGDWAGVVRVGPATGEEPHILYGDEKAFGNVAVSPDGRWIAASSAETIRLWPMPKGPPFHTLPYDELLAKLRALTNLRAVADGGSPTGYRIEAGPFPGWAHVPEW